MTGLSWGRVRVGSAALRLGLRDRPAGRLGRRRFAAAVVAGLGLGVLLVFVGLNILAFNAGPADAITYYAAADRLNMGHPLYAISPGDHWILGDKPPYWTVPLLSPPFMAVVWRPLALLPWDIALAIWWAGAMVAIGLVVAGLVRGTPLVAGAAIALLAVPLAFQVPTGNVNGYLLAAAVATWILVRNGRETEAGIVVGIAAALKLTPAILLIWLIATRRWTAVRAFAVTAVACAAISLFGAGLANHLTYLGVIEQTNLVGTTDLSLAGLLRDLGVTSSVARFAPWLAIALGTAVILARRDRPALGFAVAVLVMVWGSPVVNLDWLCLLLAVLAPLAWPIASGDPYPAATSASRIVGAPSS